ncbi:protein-methionine-sulfoxide reductase heme-binding subunit MsrQ [Phyllobacterium salinisoli]|uniref:Protein-methionine-sulfoxide reductase heme-binding subunit MsrQ n=2 Tax=Phyllobacterium salinisoli TaxID=1899321 RepID=A0A368K7K9_9HYPH|nr:protein-methionine-sulfoxide reductase heme-binding subunit MsrQ [Phyllobacterium salinisoli]RCS25194.1 protein-methionine-sulfoxide reductase heme-binding subunit MsrQ [Phyllobacterium salinisoli]
MARRTKRRSDAPIWMLYGAGLLPALWGFYLGSIGELGADPVKEFEHRLGLWALRFLILTLMVSPLREIFSINLIRYRRALGLLAFYYVAMHFSVYMILDQALDLNAVIADIIKRPFITIGMASLVILIPLAVTSNAWSIRRLGRNWVRLHRLIYVAAAGGAIHFILSVKSWPAEPVIYAAIVAILLAWRIARPFFLKRRRSTRTSATRQPRSA